MKVFCLNMAADTERLESFTKNYPESLPKFERWDAKTADDVQIPSWWRTPARYWANALNFIEMFEACANGTEDFLIFEDDCIFRPDFNERFDLFLAEVPQDWQYLNLGPVNCQGAIYTPKLISENVLRPRYFNGTHAIMIRPEFAKVCADHLRREHWGTAHVCDQWLGTLFINPDFAKVYSPLVSLCGQGEFVSTLTGKTYADRWFMNYRYLDLSGNLQSAKDPYVSEE